MKWKKKSGAWRAAIPGCQFRIKQVDVKFELAVNTDETGWAVVHQYTSLEAARVAAVSLSVDIAQVLDNREKALQLRRKQAEGLATEDPEIKRIRNLVRALLKLPKFMRASAYARLGWSSDSIELLRSLVDETEARIAGNGTKTDW